MILKLLYPLKPCYVNQRFGVNEGADYKAALGLLGHPGEDLIILNADGTNGSFGAPVRAVCDGTITQIENDTNGGWTVDQVTDQAYSWDGGADTYFRLIYAHELEGEIFVKAGDIVKAGDLIALCGASGVIPGMPEEPVHSHVHFGLKPAQLIVQGTAIPYWGNSMQNNGYGGAVDSHAYWGGYAADVVGWTKFQWQTLFAQSALLQKVVALFNKIPNK